MSSRGPQPWQPCGTEAAYRRHLRRGERPCTACREANARKSAGYRQTGFSGHQVGALIRLSDPRPVRNGIPERPYAWRARSYPWAQRVLAAAEAAHGAPEEEVA